jgi:hypothetical protein
MRLFLEEKNGAAAHARSLLALRDEADVVKDHLIRVAAAQETHFERVERWSRDRARVLGDERGEERDRA